MVEQLQRSSAADFGLRGELPYVDAVIAAVNEEANLVEEGAQARPGALARGPGAGPVFDYSIIDACLSYLVRVNIVARWSRLDPARGRELFVRLVEGLDARQLIENKQ